MMNTTRQLKCLLLSAVLFAPLTLLHATIVKMEIAFGDESSSNIYIELFDTAAPVTAGNFLNYVEDEGGTRRRYDGTFIHRVAPRFVVQGGGYKYDPTLGEFNATSAPHIDEDDPIANEFDVSRSNLRGTIAMAKLGGDPDSATSEWFFNLADNSANLDTQNGGFTVFGRVVGSTMKVVDAIAAANTRNQGGAFGKLPVINLAPPNPFTPPEPVTEANLITIRQISVDPPASIDVDTLEHDFGLVPIDTEPASKTISVQNVGATGLVIGTIGDNDALAPPYSISSEDCSGRTLSSLESCAISIEYAPKDTGVVQDSFNIPSNATNTTDLTVNLEGTGIPTDPVLEATTDDDLSFGTVGTGAQGNAEISIRNAGGGQLLPGKVSITGKNAGDFEVLDNGCDATALETSETCRIILRLNGTVRGSVSALLNISAEPGAQALSRKLTGKVILSRPVIEVPKAIETGDALVREGRSVPLEILNDGVDDLFVTEIEIVGKHAALFSTGSFCTNVPLPPGITCREKISFNSAATGEFKATLRIRSNDPDQPVKDVFIQASASRDRDGILDIIESRAANHGDGNRDGIKDALQAHVASLPTPFGNYVTLETDADKILANVRATRNPSPSDAPSSRGATIRFEHGFFDFDIEGVQPGGRATVTVWLPEGAKPDNWYMYGKTAGNQKDHWYQFNYNGLLGAEIEGNKVVLHFVDGAPGDSDLSINGRIEDPGAPATTSVSSSGGGGGGGCTLRTGLVSHALPVDLSMLLTGVLLFGWSRTTKPRRA